MHPPFEDSQVTQSVGAWGPTALGERTLALDVLRGLALFGVLIVNELTFFRISLFEGVVGRISVTINGTG